MKYSNNTMADWYQKQPGAALLKSELAGLSNVLSKIFGYYLVQVGGPIGNEDILTASRIHHHVIVNPTTPPLSDETLAVYCQLDELPFLPESVDVMVLFHTLEFANNPTIILKEIYNALIYGGHLIILGFNPLSLWGIAKFLRYNQDEVWSSKWLPPKKLKKWLSKTGFKIDSYQTLYFRPPNKDVEKMLFMEKFGQLLWPYCGASYLLVAHKVATVLTPIGKLPPLVDHTNFAKGLPKPTPRVIQCNHRIQL